MYKNSHKITQTTRINLNYGRLRLQNRFVSHMYAMLGDSDARIRNEAAIAILEFNTLQSLQRSNVRHKNSKNYLTIEFIADTLSDEVPISLDNQHGILAGFQDMMCDEHTDNRRMKKVLGKHLFDLTNMLFDFKSTEQLVRIVSISWHSKWKKNTSINQFHNNFN